MPEIVSSPPPVGALDGLFAGLGAHLSVDDVAAILNIQRPTVYKWLGDGTIPAYKVAGSWVILAEEVKAMIAAGRNQPRPRVD